MRIRMINIKTIFLLQFSNIFYYFNKYKNGWIKVVISLNVSSYEKCLRLTFEEFSIFSIGFLDRIVCSQVSFEHFYMLCCSSTESRVSRETRHDERHPQSGIYLSPPTGCMMQHKVSCLMWGIRAFPLWLWLNITQPP